jgi:hypothetical protein
VFLVVAVVSLAFLYIYDFDTINSNTVHAGKAIKNVLSQKPGYQYSSKCDCRRGDLISLNYKQDSDLYEVTSTLKNLTELDELTCGVYETLRRGRGQKVIGFSLYGKEKLYTEYLTSKKMTRGIRKLNLANCWSA